MDIGKISSSGAYQPVNVRKGGMPRTVGNEGPAGRAALSVGLSRANPLAEAPVTPEVEADLRRDDDIGQLIKTAYDYRPPQLKTGN